MTRTPAVRPGYIRFPPNGPAAPDSSLLAAATPSEPSIGRWGSSILGEMKRWCQSTLGRTVVRSRRTTPLSVSIVQGTRGAALFDRLPASNELATMNDGDNPDK